MLTYTQWNRKTTHLAIATSKDLRHWEKHGPAFAQELGGKYKDLGAKSGAVVCALQNGRLQAVKIDGKYWMYWGEGSVRLASSREFAGLAYRGRRGGKPLELLSRVPGDSRANWPRAGRRPC